LSRGIAGNFELETGSIWSASTTTQSDANRRFPASGEWPAICGHFRLGEYCIGVIAPISRQSRARHLERNAHDPFSLRIKLAAAI
jgi:hypothetical protein